MYSYTGFDRDLIPRARVRLVGVDVGIDDGAFKPDCMDAFTRKMEELKAEGVVTRVVVSLSWPLATGAVRSMRDWQLRIVLASRRSS